MMKFKRKYLFMLFAVLYFFIYLVWNKITVKRTIQVEHVGHSLVKRHPPVNPRALESSGVRVVKGSTEAPSPLKEREERGVASRTSSHKYDGFKKILYWNDAYGDPGFFFGQGHEPFVLAGCPVSTCYATHNRTLFPLEDVDAVFWHIRANDKSLPPTRSPHTYYVFWMIESALYTYEDVNTYNGIFNWTFTYRMDSDFPRPYGKVVKSPAQSTDAAAPRAATNYAQGKTKLAVWFVSNCNTLSEREILVRTLIKSLTVDVYGDCGEYKCPKSEHERCYQMMETVYKFYLSFENSLCVDYVTEKFFDVLRKNIVPVVFGLGYEHLSLPPHSYINVLDFNSVKDLADYLLYLDGNDTAYNEFFRWKSEGYAIITGSRLNQEPFCDLCERLHQAEPMPAGEPLSGDRARQDNFPVKGDVFEIESRDTRRRGSGEQQEKIPYADRHPQKESPSKHANQVNKYGTIALEHRKVYKNMHEWFVLNQCIEPFTNRALSAFIHGDVVVSTNDSRALAEEALLPYRLRPHKDLWN